jgi:tripartite-type tricarboxylate transporter receptor subunit TctC
MKGLSAFFSILALTASPVFAQGWPNKPVAIIVPFPAGGGTDVFARPLAAQLSKQLDRQFIIDNRAGAGGNLGASQAARAPKDGYTLFLGGTSVSIAPSVYPKLDYNPQKDFETIAIIAVVPQVIVVNSEHVKADNLRELIGLAKRNPGGMHYGSSGNGTVHQFAAELFKMTAGVDIAHVPYKGAAPAMQDLMGGQIEMMFDGLGGALPHIKTGRIKAIAVASRSRAAALPGVPTTAEAGMPGYEVASWYALWVPAGTPKDIVDRLGAEVGKALASPELKQIWAGLNATTGPTNPKDATVFLSDETARWAKVAKEASIKID